MGIVRFCKPQYTLPNVIPLCKMPKPSNFLIEKVIFTG